MTSPIGSLNSRLVGITDSFKPTLKIRQSRSGFQADSDSATQLTSLQTLQSRDAMHGHRHKPVWARELTRRLAWIVPQTVGKDGVMGRRGDVLFRVNSWIIYGQTKRSTKPREITRNVAPSPHRPFSLSPPLPVLSITSGAQ